jgi:hypothetical protein
MKINLEHDALPKWHAALRAALRRAEPRGWADPLAMADTAAVRALPNLDSGDSLHFNQELLAEETIDHEQRIGRILAPRKHLRELAEPELHQPWNILRMHEVGRELGHVAQPAFADFRALSICAKTPMH